MLFLLYHREDQMWWGCLNLFSHTHQEANGPLSRRLPLLKRVAPQHVRVAIWFLPASRAFYSQEMSLVGVFEACGSQYSSQGDLCVSIVLELQVHFFYDLAREL